MREILFKAKIKNWKEQSKENQWVDGYYCKRKSGRYTDIGFEEEYKDCIIKEFSDGGTIFCDIDPETICQYTGLTDKNGRKIFEGDIVKLILPGGEVRHFKVSIKSVVRKVLCHPDFDDEVSKVEITGIVFEWSDYELFPCIDTYGVPDYKMMEVIGNIFDNQDLIGDQP